ncbi:MAG: hypothetical protein IKD92_04045, partial [Lachnospiraceae bacterium]|nr:hypothetical protein [Lachnospiraceae bacterium]
MIDVVRICHAHSGVLDELMKTGNVTVAQEDRTWETMRSAGSSWRHICEAGVLRHMALLRNLRGIFAEIEDREFCIERSWRTSRRESAAGNSFPSAIIPR